MRLMRFLGVLLAALCVGGAPIVAEAQTGAAMRVRGHGVNAGSGYDLDFARNGYGIGSTQYPSPALFPGWTFARTDTNGVATALRQDGTVVAFPARTNLKINSTGSATQQLPQGGNVARGAGTAGTGIGGGTPGTLAKNATGFGARGQVNTTVVSGQTYTTSGYVLRPATFNGEYIAVGEGNAAAAVITLNPVTGAVTNVRSGVVSQRVDLQGPWLKFSVTWVATNTTSAFVFYPAYNTDGSDTEMSAIGTGYVHTIDATQLEQASVAGPPIITLGTAVTVSDPRITDRGLLVEEARTNLVPRSSPGTGWTASAATITPAAANGPDGSLTASRVQLGTTVDISTAVPGGTANKTITVSAFVRAVSANATFRLKNTHGAIADNFSPDRIATSDWQRFTFTVTNNASAGNGNQIVGLVNNVGGTGADIYVWGFQVEEGSFATSPIITTGAAATRGADVASIGGVLLPSAYTLVVEGLVPPNTAGYPRALALDSDNNNLLIFGGAEGKGGFYMGSGAVNTLSGPSQTPGQAIKFAFRAETNNARGRINGMLGSLAATFTPKTGSVTVNVGQSPGGGGIWNNYISRVRILPYAANDNQLQRMTAP